jgi:hypothetical protein
MSSVRMPFGKHQGKLLSEVPLGYLDWLLRIELKPFLREAVEEEKRLREEEGREWEEDPFSSPPSSPTSPGMDVTADVKDLVKKWFSEMALRYHPDRGGSDAAMQAINHAHQRLKDILGL